MSTGALSQGRPAGRAPCLPERKEAQADHSIVFHNTISPLHDTCSGSKARETLFKGDYDLYME